MLKFSPAALLLVLASACPASARTWLLPPPPPLPPLPKAVFTPPVSWNQVSLPQLPPLPEPSSPTRLNAPTPLAVSNQWRVVAQTPKPRWELVTPASKPVIEDVQVSSRPRWEAVPHQETITHDHILAIVKKPDPTELIVLDRLPQRWESVPASPNPSSYQLNVVDIPRPVSVLPRRVWFRF